MSTNSETPRHTIEGQPEWFSAWLPKQLPAAVEEAMEAEARAIQNEANEVALESKPQSNWFDEVRGELKLAAESLIDPSAAGIQASLPHLERAVQVFQGQLKTLEAPVTPELKPGLEALKSELHLANRLFENAYNLQAAWATQLGLNVDGTPRKALYGRSGELLTDAPPVESSWQG